MGVHSCVLLILRKKVYIYHSNLTMMNLVYLLSFLLLMNCAAASNAVVDEGAGKTNVGFEELNHFSYALTSAPFLIIDSQPEMDRVYAVIHQRIGGNRLPPIPTIREGDVYLILKPAVKKTNDVSIETMYLKGKTLYVNVKPADNPEFERNSRTAPNILLKLLNKVSFTTVKIIDLN